MKVFICILAFIVTIDGGLLPHLEAPPPLPAHSNHQIPETKVIKLIHETASLPHATLPTPPLKILRVIHESAANTANLPSLAAGPSKIIKLIHQSVSHVAPTPVSPPKIVKVIRQSASAPAPTVASAKLLRVIHEYAPRHYAPVPEGQNTRTLQIIRQQTVTPHPASISQNVRVFKVFRQGGGGSGAISALSASNGHGQTYASSYGHGYATPVSVVKVIKVLQKPAHYPSW